MTSASGRGDLKDHRQLPGETLCNGSSSNVAHQAFDFGSGWDNREDVQPVTLRRNLSGLPQERDCSAKTKEDESWSWGYELVSTDIQFNIPLENGRTSCSYQVRGALGATQAYAVPSVCLSFLPLHRNSCFSCSQWHRANDRQRENKRAGSTRSQCRLRHRGPSGAAKSPPGSLLCPWWSTGMVRFISFKLNTDLPGQRSAVQSPFGRMQRSSRISVRTPRVHRLHWGSGGAHRRPPPGPPHVCRWHAIDGTLDDQRHSQCCYKATELHRSHPGLVQFEKAPAESNKDWADLVWIRRIWKKSPISISICTSGQTSIIKPVNVVRDLGVYLDSELSMEHHISTVVPHGRVVRACFFHLRRLKFIRRILGADVTSGLVSAFVTTRMDYCNSILAALPQSSIDPLQRVQNVTARLITGTGTREHITPALRSLHWLPVKFRITFKLCVLSYASGAYRPCSFLPVCMVTATADLSSRGRLRSSNTFRYELPLLKRKFGERSFSYAGPKAWNDLPFALQELTDTCTFKRQLKTHLFTLA